MDEDRSMISMTSFDQRVESVFQEVFENENLAITDSSSAKNVENWDSLAQINIIVGLEEEFGIKFTTDEVASLANVGELKAALRAKGAA
jgi:acyl carrier protein